VEALGNCPDCPPPLNSALFVAQHVSMLVLPVVLLLLVFRCSSHPHPKSVLVISMFLVYAACSMSVKLFWQPVD